MVTGVHSVQFTKVRCKTNQQGTLSFHARKLKKQGGVPPYKSWSYLMRNEQANETGGRVFYTDATGAPLPKLFSFDTMQPDFLFQLAS